MNSGDFFPRTKSIQDFLKKLLQNTLGLKYALACSSGTVSLHLALLDLGIGPQDEVIVPALNYVAWNFLDDQWDGLFECTSVVS